ncbi:MAG: YlxR family protein [Bacillota bacterium]
MNKRDLIRIVRTPEGQVLLDETGKKSGRGAYICKQHRCFLKAIDNKSLEKALEINIDQEVEEQLREQFDNISISTD